MDLVFLVEDGVQAHFPDLAIWRDKSFYFSPLEELLSIDGHMVSHRRERRLGTLINGFVLGLLARADSENNVDPRLATRIKAIMHPTFAADAVYAVRPDDGRAEELMQWLYARHRLASSLFAQFSAQSEVTLAQLRRSFHEVQGSLRAAEKIIDHVGRPTYMLVEQIDSDNCFIPPPDTSDLTSNSVLQTTSQPLSSFIRLDLQFRANEGRGVVSVEVIGAYSEQSIIKWNRSYDRVLNGWNAFICPNSIALDQSIRVKVSWSERADGPSIGLGPKLPDATTNAVLGDSTNLGRPISLRVWAAPYQVPMPVENSTAVGPIEIDETFDQPRKVLSTSGNLLSLATAIEGQTGEVRWAPDQSGVMVHPSGKRPSIGVIANVMTEGLWNITAQVQLNHAKAMTTEFALVALPRSNIRKPPEARGRLSALFRNFGITGQGAVVKQLVSDAAWLRLAAGESGEVAFSFKVPFTGEIDIFLMTRNLTANSSYCWAMFRELTFNRKGV
jgi:hypothetical protein